MALITCPECKESISSDASSCPKCGKTLRYWTPVRIILAIILIPIVWLIATNLPRLFM
jgi:RNA polymerase subunit RPABC4/transcription elongation factor Spt4